MAASSDNTPTSFTSASSLLSSFEFGKILNEDSRAHLVYLLGTAIPEHSSARQAAILKIEKTAFSPDEYETLAKQKAWDKLTAVTCNSIYGTFSGWFAPGRSNADAQITSICPATDKRTRLVRETPQLYSNVVEPYIQSLVPRQISWVYNILDGTSEAENVIYRDEDPESGFVLTPDLKWDKTTMSSLYLLVLVQTRKIRSLRDLRPRHLHLLTKIRRDCERAAIQKYGIEEGELRFFIHYQPTYYHFHVHVTHVNYLGFSGITVGQAHLLDDIIDDLTLEASRPSPHRISHYEEKTFTYALGTEHPLYERLGEGNREYVDVKEQQNVEAVKVAAAGAGAI